MTRNTNYAVALLQIIDSKNNYQPLKIKTNFANIFYILVF